MLFEDLGIEASATPLTAKTKKKSPKKASSKGGQKESRLKKYQGRVWSIDFNRYLRPTNINEDDDGIQLSRYDHAVQNHRAVEIVFGSQSPLKSYVSESSVNEAALIQPPSSPATQRYPTTTFFSPAVTKSTDQNSLHISSAQKSDVSPLTRPPEIDHQKETVRSSGWLKIEILPAPSKSRRGGKKNLLVASKNLDTDAVVFTESAEPYMLNSAEKKELAELPFEGESESSPRAYSDISDIDKSFLSQPDLLTEVDMPDAGQSNSESPSAPTKGLKKRKSGTKSNRAIKGYTADTAVKRLCKESNNTRIQDSFINSYNEMNWEWAHLVAKALDPLQAEKPENLVAMTDTLNTWMLFFETMANVIAVNFRQVRVHVKSSVEVFEEHRDIAKILYYQIRCFYTKTRYIEIQRSFNIEKDNHKYIAPRVSDKFLLCQRFEACLKIAKETESLSHNELTLALEALVNCGSSDNHQANPPPMQPGMRHDIFDDEDLLFARNDNTMFFSSSLDSPQSQSDSSPAICESQSTSSKKDGFLDGSQDSDSEELDEINYHVKKMLGSSKF